MVATSLTRTTDWKSKDFWSFPGGPFTFLARLLSPFATLPNPQKDRFRFDEISVKRVESNRENRNTLRVLGNRSFPTPTSSGLGFGPDDTNTSSFNFERVIARDKLFPDTAK